MKYRGDITFIISLVTVSLRIQLGIDFLGLQLSLVTLIRQSSLQLLLSLDVSPQAHSSKEVGVDLLLLVSVQLLLLASSFGLLVSLGLPDSSHLHLELVELVLLDAGRGLTVEQLPTDIILEDDPGGSSLVRSPSGRHETSQSPEGRQETLAVDLLPPGQHQAVLVLQDVARDPGQQQRHHGHVVSQLVYGQDTLHRTWGSGNIYKTEFANF